MIPIIKPYLGEAEGAAASRIIASGWVTQGPEVAAFETEFAAMVGTPYACAVSSCTTALHLALLAVGVEPEDEVITASHSFIATANSIRYCGAIPYFIDIQPETYNINPSLLASAITQKTKAILVVHQMGMPCDMKAILSVAQSHSLPVIEDAACSIGSEIYWDGEWEKLGKPHGDIACFSFHPRKIITTGDGGMITTRNKVYDEQFRLWRQHGMSIPDTVRHGAQKVVFESYRTVGFNYRMTDIQASVGRIQLTRLSEILARRRHLAQKYVESLSSVKGITLPNEPEWARSNWQSYCIRLDDRFDQQSVMQAMLDHGVSTRRGIMCSHREPAYVHEPWLCNGKPPLSDFLPSNSSLKESELAQDHSIILPLYHQMTDEEFDKVVTTLTAILMKP